MERTLLATLSNDLEEQVDSARFKSLARNVALSLALGSAMSLGLVHDAQAQTATSDLSVSATVSESCTVGATSISFNVTGSGQNTDETGTLTVTCTYNTVWTATADAGQGTGATVATRIMKDAGTNTLNYSLYRDSARSQVWGSDAAQGIGGTGSGSAQNVTFYGRVPANQQVPAGTYSDTVQITVTY